MGYYDQDFHITRLFYAPTGENVVPEIS